MLVIGLTGGIGSGKTTVANLFATLGAVVFNADQIAREVVQPGSDALDQIIAKFGTQLLTTDNQLNRDKLRALVFNDPSIKIWLEKLLHPKICHAIQVKLKQVKADYVILEIPLLLETDLPLPIDRILVIDCPTAVQIQRIQSRSQLTATEIKQIINAQVSSEQRLAAADDIIVNDKDTNYLRQQVQILHQHYQTLAHNNNPSCG